ncbi:MULTISPECIES: hypothetical protein [unclassified Streptomyces]|uniref:hypothetical protein n=1 Tax=unclassified Streptomyces TaxID=2593676 RepID=UPI001489EF18|nr:MULTISPECIES: hypothetical protein [unclassified Streptomyces]
MVTPTAAENLTATGPSAPYTCWAVAYPLYEASCINLGSHQAASPRLALRWIRDRTSHVTDQLDTAYAQPGRHWLRDAAEHERALACLTAGTAYQLTLHDESTRYVLVAYPPGVLS